MRRTETYSGGLFLVLAAACVCELVGRVASSEVEKPGSIYTIERTSKKQLITVQPGHWMSVAVRAMGRTSGRSCV